MCRSKNRLSILIEDAIVSEELIRVNYVTIPHQRIDHADISLMLLRLTKKIQTCLFLMHLFISFLWLRNMMHQYLDLLVSMFHNIFVCMFQLSVRRITIQKRAQKSEFPCKTRYDYYLARSREESLCRTLEKEVSDGAIFSKSNGEIN